MPIMCYLKTVGIQTHLTINSKWNWLKLVTESDKCPWQKPWHKGHNYWREHVTVNSHLNAQLGIMQSFVVKVHKIPNSGVEWVAFTKILDRWTDGQKQQLLMSVFISCMGINKLTLLDRFTLTDSDPWVTGLLEADTGLRDSMPN